MVRGQITVFIILGIVLLLGVATVVYFTSQQVVFREGVVIDKEAQPVYDYVASCLASIAEEGIVLQGMQGGYLSLPSSIERAPASYVPMDNRGIVKVPLWVFERENRVPSLAQMETELGAYVRDNLDACLNKFSAFTYPVVSNTTPRVSATIGDQVVIRAAYPVEIRRPERTVIVNEFVSTVDVRFKEAYDLAVKTIEKENEGAWFENLTIDLMAGHPDVPFDSLEFDCAPRTWRLNDVKTTVQNILQTNLAAIRVQNTVTAPFAERANAYERVLGYSRDDFFQGRYPKNVPDDQFEYARLQFDPGVAKTNVRAAFTYRPEWGLDLNAQPNQGGVLSSKLGKGASKYLSFLCINSYHFVYDVIYPVLFTVRDEAAFKNKGFTFQMAFPVIIHNNDAARQSFGYREFTGFEQSQGFCEQLGSSVVEVRAAGLEPEFGVVELDGVNVDYQCVSKTCTLGTTHADGGFYRLTSRLPDGCIGPKITVSKDGYLPVSKYVTGDVMEFTMPRLRELKLQVVKHAYDVDAKQYSPPKLLSANEQVTVHVHAANTTYDQFVALPGTNATVSLIDGTGTYEIDALMSVFDKVVGGYQNARWVVTPRDISGSDTLTLHVIEVTPIKDGRDYALAVGEVLSDETNKVQFLPVLS